MGKLNKSGIKRIIEVYAFIILSAIIFFLAAGRLDVPRAWFCFVLYFVYTFAARKPCSLPHRTRSTSSRLLGRTVLSWPKGIPSEGLRRILFCFRPESLISSKDEVEGLGRSSRRLIYLPHGTRG